MGFWNSLKKTVGGTSWWLGDNVITKVLVDPLVEGTKNRLQQHVVGRPTNRQYLILLNADLLKAGKDAFPNLRQRLDGTRERPEDEVHDLVCFALYGDDETWEKGKEPERRHKRSMSPEEMLPVLEELAKDDTEWERFLNRMDQDAQASRVGRVASKVSTWLAEKTVATPEEVEAYKAETDRRYRKGW